MQLRNSTGEGFRLSTDGFRISVSSTPSCSSQGSGQDDIESLGDVYVWGDLWSDGTAPEGSDVLIPKPLESNIVLDVHQISCGVRHIAIVTRQGEVFTWGEESGGRLGHGIENDFIQPKLVEFLAVTNVDFVACGAYHSCAVSTSGDLFTWGDGAHNAGLLGHGTDASHWIPKRVSGPLEGLQVLSISCGTWHSALTTSNGKLFTFGDGTFGVLGHGDRESVPFPKEVQLNGLRTIKVACGVWHTAAIVEVSVSNNNMLSRKLFTWGDGDKYRLGHGNKETYLVPTCVSTLSGYNFNQIACGHAFIVALTTSGHVFTMGSTSHGQLGNPLSDGKVPCLVQDKLVGEFVEEIACGANHVVVVTSRSEVYSWGKGANGRLGHGDIDDRRVPTMIESLRDRNVKSIACGSNFTAAICIHKWVSGADQSFCTGCRQAFGFTRKRHNCYNCGLVHCGGCSSKKAIRAALAPIPSKPHRVCDACYNKLKAAASGNASFFNKKTSTAPRRSSESCKERLDKPEIKSSRILLSPTTEPVKYLEVKSQRLGAKSESLSMVRASQVPSFQQLKDIAFPSSLNALQTALRPSDAPPPPPPPFPRSSSSRPASPYRRPSPPRSATPVFSRGVIDSLKKSNDLLSQEVSKLHNHLQSLKQKCELQEEEIQKLQKNAKEASVYATEQSSKCRVATEVVRTLTYQLKEIEEKLPPEFSEMENIKAVQTQALAFVVKSSSTESSESWTSLSAGLQTEQQSSHDENKPIKHAPLTGGHKIITLDASCLKGDLSQTSENAPSNSNQTATSVVNENVSQHTSQDGVQDKSEMPSGSMTDQGTENRPAEELKTPPSSSTSQSKENGAEPLTSKGEILRESVEQFDPGVYIKFAQLRSGTKVFRRVRFSKRRFATAQAEEWWKRNRDKVLRKYVPPNQGSTSSSPSTTLPRVSPATESPSNDQNNEPTSS